MTTNTSQPVTAPALARAERLLLRHRGHRLLRHRPARRYAAVVATGRSDFPNQIDNVLAFPGIFAGALQVRASRITEGMKIAAADALADLVGDDLSAEQVTPSPFDPRVAPAVSKAVGAAACADGVARRPGGLR